MPRVKPETVAACPCAVKDCPHTCNVHRIKNHPGGALYLNCPEHGTMPTPNSHARRNPLQAWIAANSTPRLDADQVSQAAPPRPPVDPGPPPSSTPAPSSPPSAPPGAPPTAPADDDDGGWFL